MLRLLLATACFTISLVAWAQQPQTPALLPTRHEGPPTAEGYIALGGGKAQLVPAGQLRLDNHRVICGLRPTVLDAELDDYAAAYPGYIILNPRLLAQVSTPIKIFVHAQSCGYQFRGPDPNAADCFAAQRGRRQGWLTAEGMDEVCRFITPAAARPEANLPSGAERCERMRACYADPVIR